MSKALVLVAFMVLAVICVRSAVVPGRCPVVPVKDSFDVSKYLGKWYEIRSYFTIFEFGMNCSRANYTLLANGQLGVNNTATIRGRNNTRVAVNITGHAYAPDPYFPAKLNLVFDNQPSRVGTYWVVETDYVNFSIVWSCGNIAGGLFHETTSFVLSRVPTGFNGDIEATIEKTLASHNIDDSLYHPTVQENCAN